MDRVGSTNIAMRCTLAPAIAIPCATPAPRGSIQCVSQQERIEADPANVLLAKRALRSRIRDSRARMSQRQRADEAAGLTHDWLGIGGKVVAGYLATPTEPDPHGLLMQAARVLLPVPLADGELGWAIADGTHRPHERLPVSVPGGPMIGHGARPLLENRVCVLLVPALAVGKDGWRLGQGGGYYDRLLADLERCEIPNNLLVVAVVYQAELLQAGVVPHGVHDKPVKVALTSAGPAALA